MKKYVVYGGYVTSKNDGQEHYITSRKLIELYGVNPKECVCLEFSEWVNLEISLEEYKKSKEGYREGLVALNTCDDGDYTLPK